MIKDCARDVLLKLTTDIHEASRGLSATAELVKKIEDVVYQVYEGSGLPSAEQLMVSPGLTTPGL